MPALLAGWASRCSPISSSAKRSPTAGSEAVMTDWSLPLGGLHLVTPPGGPRPARVEAFAHFLAQRFARSKPKTG